MSTLQMGLNDFLKYIARQPFHETLVERYLSLAFELSPEMRREAMEELHRVLLGPNPHQALLAHYHYMKFIRSAENPDPEEEIFALQLIQSCFRELGRYNQAKVVGEEMDRIVERVQKARESEVIHESLPSPRIVLVLDSLDEDIKAHAEDQSLDPYETLGQELLFDLIKNLGNIQSSRHQRLAIEKIIQAMDKLYAKSGDRIATAIKTYGRNPLIWTQKGEFRPSVSQYFLNCKVFQMGQDTLTALRIRMVLEMLMAHYDQRMMGTVEVEKERDTRLRLLSEMISIFLDAGVTFPSFVMGAS